MDKFVSYGKLSKKEQKKLSAEKRRDWNGFNPVTRVVPDSKKVYRRKPKHPDDFFGD